MTGLYIHIPFCVKKCTYCDFASLPGNKWDDSLVKAYLSAVNEEISSLFPHQASNLPVDTIFIGGGTPSILTPSQIESLLLNIGNFYGVSTACEISMEMNPGTVENKDIKDYVKAGINRLSIGVQSFDEDNLRLLGRIHSPQQARSAVERAKKADIYSVGIDLIYGIPRQTMFSWRMDLSIAISLDPNHISCYCLTPEEETPLGDAILQGNSPQPDDENLIEMMEETRQTLETAGYLQYEISNYARKGFECRHNLKYWKMEDYLGFGASACSYFNRWRLCNVKSPQTYIERIEKSLIPLKFAERISKKRCMGEYIMMGLRMNRGIKKIDFEKRFGARIEDIYKNEITQLMEKGWIQEGSPIGESANYFIPAAHLAIQSEIAGEFIG